MKKFLSLLLCLMLSCFSFASAGGIISLSLNHQKLHEYRSALESEPVRYTSGKYAYILLSDGTAEIVEYLPPVLRINSLKIPAELDGHAVTSIGEGVFRGIQIGTLTLPDTLTFLGNHAFAQTALTEITLPDSLTTILNYAFENCTGLTELVIPAGVKIIEADVFKGCTNLTLVVTKGSYAEQYAKDVGIAYRSVSAATPKPT